MTITIALNSPADPKCTNEIVLRDVNKIQIGSFFVKDVRDMCIEFDK